MEKVIYLAGGCYWGAEKFLSSLQGVTATTVGFANGNTVAPSYEQVKHENTGHAETVKVVYDPEVISLSVMLRAFWNIIDPTSLNRQGEDIGTQYRTGVYYENTEDVEIAQAELTRLAQRINAEIAVELLPLQHFYTAEEYHQKYLDKNPNGYCHVPFAKIRLAASFRPASDDPETFFITDDAPHS